MDGCERPRAQERSFFRPTSRRVLSRTCSRRSQQRFRAVRHGSRIIAIVAVVLLLAARSARADGRPLPDQDRGHLASPAAVVDGPPPPVAPAVVARDQDGRATVRAIALDRPLRLDGVLDEDVYESIPSISDFIQQVPKEGAPATERTEAWVLFDADNIYVACRCWDSAPPDRWIATSCAATHQLRQNDTFGVILDTFYDHRNGYLLYTNPLGARADQAVTDEGTLNPDWNPVWDVRTGRFEGGWTVEMRIPFKSLRYRSGASQIWGINIRRVIRRRTNANLSLFGLVWRARWHLRLPQQARCRLNLPPASRMWSEAVRISRLTRTASSPVDPIERSRRHRRLGCEVRNHSESHGRSAVNTDFAQVEVDEQRSTSRVSPCRSEKRDFFLEDAAC